MRFEEFLRQLGELTEFEYNGSASGDFQGLATNPASRKMPGRFLTIVGGEWERLGSRYQVPNGDVEAALEDALRKGARGLVVPRSARGANYLQGVDCFIVESTLEFAFRAAEVMAKDRPADRRVTAITGSVGKTTTKAMLVHALRNAMPAEDLDETTGLNNLYPSILAKLSRPMKRRHTVLEVASSVFVAFQKRNFEMNADVSIVTAIAESHLSLHGSVEGVARDKSEIFKDPPAGGVAVVNYDTSFAELLLRSASDAGRRVVTYGRNPDATIRLHAYDVTSGEVTAEVAEELITYKVGARGEHMALNSLAVLATLRAYDLPRWREGVESLADFKAVNGRGDWYDLAFGPARVRVIDESYNANPASMRAALAAFSAAGDLYKGRRIAVLGDMLELGKSSDSAHRDLAELILDVGFDEVHLVGEHMTVLYEEVGDQSHVHHWRNVEDLIGSLRQIVRDGDTILAKASRGTGLKKALSALRATNSE